MKMIGHEAPGQYISKRQYMNPDLLQEKPVVFVIKKNRLPVIALVIDMIYATGFEVHYINCYLVFQSVLLSPLLVGVRLKVAPRLEPPLAGYCPGYKYDIRRRFRNTYYLQLFWVFVI
jgi:hypothetical protein